MSSFTAIAILATSVALLLWNYGRKAPRAKVPPGPPFYPLLGQLLSAPTSFEQIEYKKISDRLNSNIISLQFLGSTLVILSSAQMADDLLERRSVRYSDRPQTIMLTDPQLMDWEHAVLFTQYGDRLRSYRRIFNTWLSKTATLKFRDNQIAQVRGMLRRFLALGVQPISSDAINKETSRLAAATLLYAAYGYDVTSLDDPFVLLARRAAEISSQIALPSNFLVNIFPSLLRVPEWVPGVGWKRLAREWRAEKDLAINEPFEWTKRQIASGIAQPSIVRSILESLQKPTENGVPSPDEQDCKEVALALFGGGSSTMAGTLMTFILAMARFPEAQAKAQREIDEIIGNSRLPDINDKEELPYVRNLIQEVMRWRPVLPLGVPHVCSEDDSFEGYHVPKGAIIIGNVWAMSRDETIYENPDAFNPDRFSEPNASSLPVFGWGRRKCPGAHFAETLIFSCIASILAAFNIRGITDTEEHETFSDIPDNGIIYHPNSFSCLIEPRSKEYEAIIEGFTD